MTLAARIYAITDGLEDPMAVKDKLADALAERLAAGLLTGYEATVVDTEEEWDEQGLDREVIADVTGGRLPFVYVNLTYDVDDPRQRDADHADLIEAFRMRPVLEVTDR
jgi:hypothetical protein